MYYYDTEQTGATVHLVSRAEGEVLWEHRKHVKGIHSFFRVLQTFTRVNKSEPKKCYLFPLENSAFKKKEKLFVISIFQNVNILCACSIITLSTRISPEF